MSRTPGADVGYRPDRGFKWTAEEADPGASEALRGDARVSIAAT